MNQEGSMIRVKDLADQISQPRPRAFLYCTICGSETSAHRGDYFLAHPDTVLTCCDAPLIRVVRRTQLIEV